MLLRSLTKLLRSPEKVCVHSQNFDENDGKIMWWRKVSQGNTIFW